MAQWSFANDWSLFLGWRATAIGILDGYLMLAVRPSLYQQAITTLAGSKSLADELDYKLIASKIRDNERALEAAQLDEAEGRPVLRGGRSLTPGVGNTES